MGGKTSNESKAKYNAKAYDRINIAVPKGQKDAIQAAAAARGESVNAYLNRIVAEAMARDSAPPDAPQSVTNAPVSPSDSVPAPGATPIPGTAENASSGK